MTKYQYVLTATAVLIGIVLFLAAELLFIKNNGTPVPAPAIPRDAQVLGTGPKLTYVVMGDSTSIGQGTDYEHAYAPISAKHLAMNYEVTFVNVGISGATAASVLAVQLPQAITYKPDVVLLAVGANDATHFVKGKAFQTSIQSIIDGLRAANPAVKIVVTGSPAMDSVARFPWPARQLMGLRTRQINAAYTPIIVKNNLTFAKIAQGTRAAFLADPTLLAPDKFHPNGRGYALWVPIVNAALDQAVK